MNLAAKCVILMVAIAIPHAAAIGGEERPNNADALYEQAFSLMTRHTPDYDSIGDVVAEASAIHEDQIADVKKWLRDNDAALRFFRQASQAAGAAWGSVDFDARWRRIRNMHQMAQLLSVHSRMSYAEGLPEQSLEDVESMLDSAFHLMPPRHENGSYNEFLAGLAIINMAHRPFDVLLGDAKTAERAKTLKMKYAAFPETSVLGDLHQIEHARAMEEILSHAGRMADAHEWMDWLQDEFELNCEKTRSDFRADEALQAFESSMMRRNEALREILSLPIGGILTPLGELEAADNAQRALLAEAFCAAAPAAEINALLGEMLAQSFFHDLTHMVKMEMAMRNRFLK